MVGNNFLVPFTIVIEIYILMAKAETEGTTPEYNHTRLRLVDGSSQYEGIIELYYQGSWGTICSDQFRISDGTVICRQLGFGEVDSYHSDLRDGGRSGPILDNINCYGYESVLDDCFLDQWGYRYCSHANDIWIKCFPLRHETTPTISNTRVRLANGISRYEGRVEIYYNGLWGTICDDAFDIIDGTVVCRQLGFGDADSYHSDAYYGEGSGPTLGYINCHSNDTGLDDCYLGAWETSSCAHYNDVGVRCFSEGPDTTMSDDVIAVRLRDGSNQYEGRVEIYHNGTWSTVCGDTFDIDDAAVVCRQLNYEHPIEYYSRAHFGNGSGPILGTIDCAKYKRQLSSCSLSAWNTADCIHSKDAGVSCGMPMKEVTKDGMVRLVNGTSERNGLLQIYHNGQWGTICDDSWDYYGSYVVCRQLGYPSADSPSEKSGGKHTTGSGPILLDNVECLGSEDSLTDCKHDGWYNNDCTHVEDVSVSCQEPCSAHASLCGSGSQNYVQPAYRGHSLSQFERIMAITLLIIGLCVTPSLIIYGVYHHIIKRRQKFHNVPDSSDDHIDVIPQDDENAVTIPLSQDIITATIHSGTDAETYNSSDITNIDDEVA